MNQLNAFEKFLKGKKTYLVSVGAVVYSVLLYGFHMHHWTNIGGAWTWVFSASGLAAIRAALAAHFSTVVNAIWASSNQVAPGPVVPPAGAPVPPLTPPAA